MRLNITAVVTAAKEINKARVTGKISLVAVAKVNLLNYYIEFADEQIALGREEYKEKRKILVEKYNRLVFSCPDIICNIDGPYTYIGVINNPYKPQVPSTPVVVEPEPVNLPPTIDDNTITVDNNVTTTLSLAMFTTDARYSDPEGDLLDAIRVDLIYSNNLGTFYVDGIELTKGQIITREQLEAGAFTHVGANVTTIQKDGFEFSVRDEGSQIWVN